MIKEFVNAWEANKETLEGYFRTHKMCEYDSYRALVKLLFDIVINPSVALYDTKNIDVLDHGGWQGTEVFILHRDCYQPSVTDYVYTSVSYGSCSFCDTLQGIHGYDGDKLPDDEQVKDYMLLCLHLLQRCSYMVDGEDTAELTVAYICDGKQCENCDTELCQHTTDICHAKNFERDDQRGIMYWEKEVESDD